MTDAPELLPCPFCGESEIHLIPGAYNSVQARCSDCFCYGPTAPSDTEATALWNSRADPDREDIRSLEWEHLGGNCYRAPAPEIQTALQCLRDAIGAYGDPNRQPGDRNLDELRRPT